MEFLHLDSWPFKIALILSILGAREFVRITTTMAARERMPASRGPMGARRPGPQPSENARWVIETLDSAAIAIGLVLFVIQPFLIQAFYIPSGSMEDTLRVDDRLLVSKMIYHLRDPRFEDVVVFKAPPMAKETSAGLPEEGETDFIKRCIGTPGDVVFVKGRQVFRQAKGQASAVLLSEPYVKWSADKQLQKYDMKIVDGEVYSRESSIDEWTFAGKPVPHARQQYITSAPNGAVPEGQYLVLGDHRNDSNDGHVWGFVPRENFVGKALCVFWPPTRVGVLDNMSFHPRAPQRERTSPTGLSIP